MRCSGISLSSPRTNHYPIQKLPHRQDGLYPNLAQQISGEWDIGISLFGGFPAIRRRGHEVCLSSDICGQTRLSAVRAWG